jgi:multiple sugar transport system substrate-binding protein
MADAGDSRCGGVCRSSIWRQRRAAEEAGPLTHWDQNPEFNKWYADKGKEFAKKTGYEVEVVTIPYQGYEAKYLAAFMAKNSAPDIFMGMTHHWCGQYDFCDKMPADLAKTYDDNLPKYMAEVGKWKGVRYGFPIEHGNFQQMYINVDMFKKAGLNPDDPPKTFDNGWRT